MKKKALSFALAVCLLMALLPLKAFAIELDYVMYPICGGYIRVNRYTGVLQSGSYSLNTESGTSEPALVGDLSIPGEVEGVRIRSIANDAFYGFDRLTSVTVPPTVKSIGDNAFAACTSLKTATILEGVESLGQGAFLFCYSLTSVSLPSTLEAVSDSAFEKCIALRSVSIPSGVKRVGENAFNGCLKLTAASVPSTVTELGNYCFNDCSALQSITLPPAATIPVACLNGCSSLETVIIPEGVQRISDLAFRGCTGLKSISVPASVKSIAGSAFERCDQMTFYLKRGSFAQAFAAANKIPFVEGELEEPPDNDPGKYPATPFTDDKNHWGRKYIEWAYAMGYFSGTSETTFSPNMPLNRGMLVTLLHRIEGRPSAGTSSFSDVSSGAYYAGAVAWAEKNRIVSGIGGGRFAPSQDITREQLVTMLYRYAQYKGMDVSKTADLSRFKDTDRISSYAGAAMAWAVGSGIVNGTESVTLSPRGNATRAQAAVMLQKFLNQR